MCSCGCNSPTSPTVGPGASSTGGGSIAPCPSAQSAIQVIDELGIPLANCPVTFRLSSGAVHSHTTDANGFVCLNLPPNTQGQLDISNVHEVRKGNATTTPSGQHFRVNGTGP